MQAELNSVELSMLIAALKQHGRDLGRNDKEGAMFADGLRARLRGLERCGEASEVFCPSCSWDGRSDEMNCPRCVFRLHVTRGGVPVEMARRADAANAR